MACSPPYLVDLAFRMLGDIGAAEDVVQDTFARLLRAPRGEIEDDRGWLIVVTSRGCRARHVRPAAPRAARRDRGRPRLADRGDQLHYWGPGTTLVSHPAAGHPALLGFTGRALTGVLVFTMRDGKVESVQVIGDPRKLSFVTSRLS